MANEKRLINAPDLGITLARRMTPMVLQDSPADAIYKAMLACVANTPAADAVEVVRCKDCTEWDEKQQECSHWYGFHENDFCSYGEKREVE